MGGSPRRCRLLANSHLRARLLWIRLALSRDESRLAAVPSPAQHWTISRRRAHDPQGGTLDAAPLENRRLFVQYHTHHKLDLPGDYHWRIGAAARRTDAIPRRHRAVFVVGRMESRIALSGSNRLLHRGRNAIAAGQIGSISLAGAFDRCRDWLV